MNGLLLTLDSDPQLLFTILRIQSSILNVSHSSVVPIVASYRKLVAKAKNRRLSIENFHNRLSVIVLG